MSNLPLKLPRLTLARHGFWLAVVLSSAAVGLVSLRYGLPRVPYPAPLPSFAREHGWLVLHAIAASLALILGPWQFLAGVRRRQPRLHRSVGRAYLVALFLAAIASVPVALHAVGGFVSTAGFLTLAAAWLVTSAMGTVRILQHRVADHRIWMIRCFSLTFAAVTLRLLLAIRPATGMSFETAYPIIAWMSWVPNLLVAELWLRGWVNWPSAARRPHAVRDPGAACLVDPLPFSES